jgi:hypothetical protein
MKMSHALRCLSCLAVLMLIPTPAGESKSAVGPGSVIVHSKFGGQIFGFNIASNLSRTKSSEGTPDMNIQSQVSFLTNNAEVKTIAATSALYSILPDRMTGWSAVASSKAGLGSTRRFSI